MIKSFIIIDSTLYLSNLYITSFRDVIEVQFNVNFYDFDCGQIVFQGQRGRNGNPDEVRYLVSGTKGGEKAVQYLESYLNLPIIYKSYGGYSTNIPINNVRYLGIPESHDTEEILKVEDLWKRKLKY